MDDETEMLIAGIVLGFLIGGVMSFIMIGDDKQQLGQAICDQEFKMDYSSYSTEDGLVCQPKVIKEHYDGIKISKEAKKQ